MHEDQTNTFRVVDDDYHAPSDVSDEFSFPSDVYMFTNNDGRLA
jgi:hypothetical protein